MFRAQQPESGYPIKLPIGTKDPSRHNKPENEGIHPQPEILVAVHQQACPKAHQDTTYTSSTTLNHLTVNLGSVTKHPKLNDREMKDTYINEADAFLRNPRGRRTSSKVHPQRTQGHRLEILDSSANGLLCSRQPQCWHATFLTEPNMYSDDTLAPAVTNKILHTALRPQIAWQPRARFWGAPSSR